MQICKIERVRKESIVHKTFFFSYKACRNAKPGQFVMIWIPGIDEIPMSLSYIDKMQAITVEKVGEATEFMHRLKEGDIIGIRGPYGKGFEIVGEKALFIGGGTGIAALLPLIKNYEGEKHVILGARKKDYIIFEDEIKKIADLHITTDDGSYGKKGMATDLLHEFKDVDVIYTCGPEKMIKKIFDFCIQESIPMQASLERYMKCGVGICDSCAIDGYHVCKDGPVFNEKMLLGIKDFGKWKRNEAGKRISI